jgi:hypothetical protein
MKMPMAVPQTKKPAISPKSPSDMTSTLSAGMSKQRMWLIIGKAVAILGSLYGK